MGAPGGSLESNHKATPLTSSASLLEKDQTYSTDTVAAIGTKTERIPMRRALVAQDSAGSFDRYLFPTNISFGIPEGTTLSEEFTKKQPLLVAITTKFKNLERAAAIYDTWALDVGQVVFFIAEEGNLTSFPVARGLPIVKLPGTHCIMYDQLLCTILARLYSLLENTPPSSGAKLLHRVFIS